MYMDISRGYIHGTWRLWERSTPKNGLDRDGFERNEEADTADYWTWSGIKKEAHNINIYMYNVCTYIRVI